MNTNIEKEISDHKKVVDGVSQVLAETYVLYLKTHNFHWNVTGPMFQPLHSVFEEQYSELADAVDEVAERIRALGMRAPGSFSEFQSLSSIKEATGQPKAMDMIEKLLDDHETLSETANNTAVTAQESGDEATADLMIQRIQVHDKAAWMLRSFLA
jgi:starvation-inducible DNA-binding protein